MKITIYGAGYVGLVSGACFADVGHQVLIVDIDKKKLSQLKQGESPIYEPGLTEMLKRNIKAGKLAFTDDMPKAVAHGLIQFIAVGTPSLADGTADMQHVHAVAKYIGENLTEYRVIVNKSTVPVGGCYEVKNIIQQELRRRNANIEFAIVSNPEFLKEGAAIEDFLKPDRIIVGVENEKSLNNMRELYAALIGNTKHFLVMDVSSAELTKYAANAFLATKISFMNEMSQIAERVNADIELVRQGIGSDQRIGPHFLFAGCGYGGSCFPKDVRALQQIAKQVGAKTHLLPAVEAVNVQQKQILSDKIKQHFNQQLHNKVIAVWGLAFKPNTDDMREASSRTLMESLWQQGVKVQAYDPVAMHEAEKIYGSRQDFKLCQTAEAALEGADALAIVTEWQEFREPNFALIKSKLRHPVIFDGRNLYETKQLTQLGLTYYAIGRGNN